MAKTFEAVVTFGETRLSYFLNRKSDLLPIVAGLVAGWGSQRPSLAVVVRDVDTGEVSLILHWDAGKPAPALVAGDGDSEEWF